MNDLGVSSGDEALAILQKLVQNGQITKEHIISFVNKKPTQQKNSSPKSTPMTRHIALLWHYDGSTYTGLAENMDCISDNSVEKHLFSALLKTCLVSSSDRKQCNYSRCGRTDKGVSAFGQVCALRVRSAFPEGCKIRASSSDALGSDEFSIMQEIDLPKNSIDEVECFVPPKRKQKASRPELECSSDNTYDRPIETSTDENALVPMKVKEIQYDLILNNVLPPTIRILGWCPVSDDFSARFSAVHRTYRYYFVRRNLNLEQMQLALTKMIGRHDFRNLCKINLEEVDNFERLILDATIVKCHPWSDYAGSLYESVSKVSISSTVLDQDSSQCNNRQLCFVQITGQAFLWHQIRHIMALLFMIGKGLEEASVVDELLDIGRNPGKPSYTMAPDLPLVLHACGYNNLKFGRSVRNLWNLSCDLETKWEDLALASERIRNGVDSLKTEALVRTDDLITFINQTLEVQRKKSKSKKEFTTEDRKNISPHDLGEDSTFISWGDALELIDKYCKMQPSPYTEKPCLHVPLMERGRGTTYEEKVRSILAPCNHEKRRRDRYEDNIIRKKHIAKDGDNFFEEKSRQGGSCI